MKNNQQCLLNFTPRDEYSLRRGEKALQTLLNFSEIVEHIEQGNTLHGKPLEIVLGKTAKYSGYDPATHQIYYNPDITDEDYSLDLSGNLFPETTERFFAHVIGHTIQDGFVQAALAYDAKLSAISNNITQPFFQAVLNQGDAIRSAIGNEAAIRAIIAPLHQEYIGDVLEPQLADIEKQLKTDPAIITFNNGFETPAIEFENIIATQYLNEPIRSTDYVKYMLYKIKLSVDSEKMILGFITSLHRPRTGAQPTSYTPLWSR